MSYERLNWKNGEIITADKLNHMDNGISESIENNINDIQLENNDTLVIIKNQNRKI